MKFIKIIKDIIFKIKDYERLEFAYCGLLDCATGGILSKPNYTEETIHEAINEYLQEQYKYVEEDYLNRLKEDAFTATAESLQNGDLMLRIENPNVKLFGKVKVILVEE